MSALAKIKCDLCGFISDLEGGANRGALRTPNGWANIYTMVSILGRKHDDTKKDKDERKSLKLRIEKKFPAFHICPGCIRGEFDLRTTIALPGGLRNVNTL